MKDYSPFKVGLEEIVLELQMREDKAHFQFRISEGNEIYAKGLLGYFKGRYKQAKEIFEYVSALYENAVAQYELIRMNRG